MKKLALLLIITVFLHSCASILNGKKTLVKISTDNKSTIIFKNDTLLTSEKQVIIQPKRSKKPLKITILKDSLREDFYFNRKISAVFGLNIMGVYGLGFLVDLTNNKRFTYQRNLHFITDTLSKKIVISNKKVTLLPKNKFFIYTSPLHAFDVFSIPMATLGSEYFIQNNISLSAEYGINLPNNQTRNNTISYLNEQAITYKFETKFYNLINFTNNVFLNEYISLEFREIKNQYNDKINYFDDENQSDFITDDFATKKRVTIVNLKYGLLIPIGKRFYLDVYSGFGIRIKKFKHINLEYDKMIHQIDFSDDFTFFDLRSFKNYNQKSFLNYSLGFKFGLKL
ncbi:MULTISPECIES: hypothetical protein [unclassified Polaribacter]|uniref:hypothetical protein n=1 Tax=unclassified Polaribacter TaxID=196858 RepID=UPI0011BF9072|nr:MULTISPECIES: hypothetical protein [unclassified Polaribacter]TXD50886.1 hypothetical protein ES043_14250 [Polaribacter sp. IC063]TXD57559.1 hypothetical protein ES044_14630 [Polaribacter sp. IC066]